MSEAIHRDLMEWDEFPPYDVLYTDPPWGDRMMKFFQTQQRKATGSAPAHTFADIARKLFGLAARDRPLIVEFSSDYSELLEPAALAGHQFVAATRAVQTSGREYAIVQFNVDLDMPDGVAGFDAVTWTVHWLRPKVMFDPCAGLGATAKAALKAGCPCYIGAEPNRARYERLAAVLR